MSKSKRAVQCVNNEEPAFIRQFKQKIGYKEAPTVEAKRAALERDLSGSEDEGEEEKPSIVVLKKGHLTAEEVENLKKQGSQVEFEVEDKKDEEPPHDGSRILFKKPTKRSSTADSEKDEEKKKKKSQKKIKNKSLLSFDEEEGEDD